MRDKKTVDLPNAAGNVIGPPSLPFLVLFGLLFVVVTHFLGNMLPESALDWMMRSTAYLAALFLKVLGLSAAVEGIRVVLPGFAMKVNLECTAVHFLGIFWVGILAYPHHRIVYKLQGLVAGTVLIIALNVLRIGVVGIIGMHSAEFAVFVHTYLWQGVFAVVVLLLWILWTKGPSAPGMPVLKFAVIFLAASALAVLALEFIMPVYVRALAFFAGPLLRSLPWTADSVVAASGDSIQYIVGTRLFSYAVSTDILDASMFVSLMAATTGMGRFVRRIALIIGGYAVLLFTHLLFVITVGAVVFKLTPTVLSDVFWILRSVSVFIPIALWLVIRRWFRNDPKNNSLKYCNTGVRNRENRHI